MTHGDVKGSRTLLMITADGGRGTHSSSMRRTLRTGAELPTSTYAVHSLERAASLLRSFSAAEPELTIGELARRNNLPRSTVHRLVVNLMRLGFLARDARTERYRLGLLLAELVEGRHGLRLRATVGSSTPLHASATGTVLLAYMPEAEVRRLAVETGLPKLTARWVVNRVQHGVPHLARRSTAPARSVVNAPSCSATRPLMSTCCTPVAY